MTAPPADVVSGPPERTDTAADLTAGLGDDRAGLDADAAFDAFCRRDHAAVAGLAYVLTGDWAVAEDLAQEAFLAAYRKWDSVRRYDRPGAWVRRVVANRAVSWRRRRRNESVALTRLAARPVTAVGPPVTADEELWAALRKLPARQAQVFALTYVEDLAASQVAEVLGIAEGTAKAHLQRARVTLSARLGASEQERTNHDR